MFILIMPSSCVMLLLMFCKHNRSSLIHQEIAVHKGRWPVPINLFSMFFVIVMLLHLKMDNITENDTTICLQNILPEASIWCRIYLCLSSDHKSHDFSCGIRVHNLKSHMPQSHL
jgi:hypothetical protein